ncbi:xanthine phosphoribosyltransferase [Cohnella thailandensis]|jgi:xanthine phosphoribosyltransferase|uniref:Xanthine phosphoribosyltransferase n=1 Tax=Cohnella thailandensis TaxID=557557 RepID=A0A841SX28_9BACL|nr:xanthine phosphoribosyltransferase [Cohnella thailandensis]MBB6634728.1 xanthine phosphoribosyltransferase [Cohnella thailandensis]MBP1972716.1 xanthine phosphoribosyltransferase [Cohnella thailandensis]
MDILKERILQEATIVNSGVLKLDSLLNHGVDPQLTMEMGKEFARRFEGKKITKVITVESSGIPVAFATALTLGVPLVFARRKKTLLGDADAYVERVPSFTKGIVTDLIVSRHLLGAEDSVLFIDDIIANGDAARGLLKIIEQAGASVAGIGIVLEKSFQAGGKALRELGFQVETLVRISSLEGETITFE